jgi:BirA family biotin operon repressor/biotin-[acetyl-CoA-carboxylase] ligase
MNFSQSAQLAKRLDWVESTGSTNSDLIAAATADSAAYPDFSVLVTSEQTAGRGRSGREWQAPAGSSLFVSVLLRPGSVAATQFAWLPLIAGMSMANAISQFAGSQRAQVKWPNDVLIGEKKVCGVLSELLPDVSGVVIGAGVNVFQSLEELPVETATSLALERIAIESLDDLLAAYLKNLRLNLDDFIALAGELDATDLHEQISMTCSTIGREVRVLLPNDQQFVGKAIAIDSIGRLVVQNESETRSVSVGDVVHLRHN